VKFEKIVLTLYSNCVSASALPSVFAVLHCWAVRIVAGDSHISDAEFAVNIVFFNGMALTTDVMVIRCLTLPYCRSANPRTLSAYKLYFSHTDLYRN